jgi:hypothetical protein
MDTTVTCTNRNLSNDAAAGGAFTSPCCRVGIHWFRNGLRFHDNPSFRDACLQSRHYLLPLVILGPSSDVSAVSSSLVQSPGVPVGIVRANFYLESLADLNAKLAGTMRRSKLVVVATALPIHTVVSIVVKACQQFALELHVDEAQTQAAGDQDGSNNDVASSSTASSSDNDVTIFYEQDVAEPVRRRDAMVWAAVKDATGGDSPSTGSSSSGRVRIHRYETQTLHPMERYAARCKQHGGVAPPTYGGFLKAFDSLGAVPRPVPDVTNDDVPDLLPVPVLERIAVALRNEEENNNNHEGVDGTAARTAVVKLGEIPTLRDLGYTEKQIRELEASFRRRPDDHLRGGETRALDRLRTAMERTTWVAQFEKPKTVPNALTFDTTALSPCTF